ncbi:MAG: TetR/AcrR family transcriptional regulator, partial [Bradyrhizobiaceae bacterium]
MNTDTTRPRPARPGARRCHETERGPAETVDDTASSARFAMTRRLLRDIEPMTTIRSAQESLGMGLTATRTRAAAPRREAQKSRGGRPTKSAAIERDQRLIEVATRLFLDRGFDATSLDAVAEAARVSKPTVYSRYG